jgi:hypothetical protein
MALTVRYAILAIEPVMLGLVPPAGPKPLRRGGGPGIHVFLSFKRQDVDGKNKSGHDE